MAEESTTADDSGSGDIQPTDFDQDDTQNNQDKTADTTQAGDDADNLTDQDDATAAKGDVAPTKIDDDLDTWIEKSGHDKPETDRERKLLQDLRNSSREFTSKRQAQKTASDLQKSITQAKPADTATDDAIVDPLEKDVKALRDELYQERTSRLQSEYFSLNDVTPEEVTLMGAILKEKADRGDMGAFTYLSDARNLSDLHDLVKIRMSATQGTNIADKARAEERERLAKLSKSGATTKSAKSNAPAPKVDELTALWTNDD